jgi:hypothetical protein
MYAPSKIATQTNSVVPSLKQDLSVSQQAPVSLLHPDKQGFGLQVEFVPFQVDDPAHSASVTWPQLSPLQQAPLIMAKQFNVSQSSLK